MDQGSLFADALAVAHAEVERRADDDDDVSLAECRTAGAVEIMRIARRQHAARRAVHIGRNIQLADQVDRLVVAARRPDLGAVKDRRPLGLDQDVGQLLDILRVADRLGRGAVGAGGRNARLGQWNLAIQHIARDLQIGRAGCAVVGFAGRHGDHVRDPVGRPHAGGKLGDRRHDVDMRQILQRAHLMLGQRALAADMDHRCLGSEGRGDAGHRVGAAGPRRGHHAAQLAGLAGIAVGGMGRHLFMAHIDDADAFVQAAVIDVDDVTAAKRKDRVHTLVLQGLGDEIAARNNLAGLVLPDQRVCCRVTHFVSPSFDRPARGQYRAFSGKNGAFRRRGSVSD